MAASSAPKYRNLIKLKDIDEIMEGYDYSKGPIEYNYNKLRSFGFSDYMKEHEISRTALLSLILSYYYYESFLKTGHTMFLKEQLSWIGMDYDKNNWYGYKNNNNELDQLISSYHERQWFCETDITNFRTEFLKIATKFSCMSVNIQQKLRRVKNPSIKTINQILEELNKQYIVESKQMSKNGRKTFWRIVET